MLIHFLIYLLLMLLALLHKSGRISDNRPEISTQLKIRRHIISAAKIT